MSVHPAPAVAEAAAAAADMPVSTLVFAEAVAMVAAASKQLAAVQPAAAVAVV